MTSLSEPPEGVVRGEDVPLENQQEDITETEIQKMANSLKERGQPWSTMNDSELRENAIDRIRRLGGDI